MANTRIKVPRMTLIARLQERIDEATKKYEAEVARYEKERDEFITSLPKVLEEKAAKIKAMKPEEALEFYRTLRGNAWDEHVTMTFKAKWPEAVSEEGFEYSAPEGRYRYSRRGFKGYVEELEKSKRILEASTEEFISVSATDFYADIL